MFHFWHHCNQILSDLQQLPDEGVHALSNRICTIITKCKFSSEEVTETMKIMVMQHAIKYHEARDWICLQDQTTLMYQSLLAHCKQLEARCEQFQQAQAQGRAHLTSVTSASSSKSSIHADIQSTTKQSCSICAYTHSCGNCPAYNHECFNCHNTGPSLPCAEDLTTTDIQQTPPTGAESPEVGPKDLAVGEDHADHLAERGKHTEALPTIQASQDT